MSRLVLSLSLSFCLSFCLSGCPDTPPETSTETNPTPTSHLASTEPVQPVPFVLLAVGPERMEPIVRYQPDTQSFASALPDRSQSSESPSDADTEMLKKLVPQDVRYPIYLNGSQRSQFEIERLDPPGCGDYPQIMGKLNPPVKVPDNESFQAFAYAPANTPLARFSPPPAPEGANLNDMGEMLKTAFFAGRADLQAEAFLLDHIRSFPFQKTAGGEMELGLLISGRRSDEAHAAFCGQETFWVLGIWEQGRAVPLASYLHPKSDYPEDCQASDLVGSFSTGPALDHVVIQHNGYEWWTYSIYAWREDSWKEVFRGGGGGC